MVAQYDGHDIYIKDEFLTKTAKDVSESRPVTN